MLFRLIAILWLTIPSIAICKVYDGFLYFNEEEVLKIHLDELYDAVDAFIIVESSQTFSGNTKEYNFPKIQHQLVPYLDKIRYIQVDEHLEGCRAWDRETYQRNQIMRGLTDCRWDDIVIISDADEIVRPELVPQMVEKLSTQKFPVIGCDCDFYRWYLNRKDHTTLIGPVVTSYGFLKESSPQKARDARFSYIWDRSAWHFSNMGGLKTFLEKVRNFSHFDEVDADAIEKDPSALYETISKFSLVEIDASFPKYIQEHLKYYQEIEWIDSENGAYR